MLDYDGTLVQFESNPEEARPDEDLLNLLKKISADKKNELVIISGRDRNTLEKWVGDINVSLVAEHGVEIRENGNPWEIIEKLSADWKKEIRPILDRYAEKTPRSFVEEKKYSLAWHYRNSGLILGTSRKRELVGVLAEVASSFDLQILEGNKVIEIKSARINKGKITSRFVAKDNWDFILAMGDDTTDEDIFTVLPERAYSIKVGLGHSQAKFNFKSIKDVRPLLRELK